MCPDRRDTDLWALLRNTPHMGVPAWMKLVPKQDMSSRQSSSNDVCEAGGGRGLVYMGSYKTSCGEKNSLPDSLLIIEEKNYWPASCAFKKKNPKKTPPKTKKPWNRIPGGLSAVLALGVVPREQVSFKTFPSHPGTVTVVDSTSLPGAQKWGKNILGNTA